MRALHNNLKGLGAANTHVRTKMLILTSNKYNFVKDNVVYEGDLRAHVGVEGRFGHISTFALKHKHDFRLASFKLRRKPACEDSGSMIAAALATAAAKISARANTGKHHHQQMRPPEQLD